MVGHQLLELVMGVRILLPEQFLIQVKMHLRLAKVSVRGTCLEINENANQKKRKQSL